MSDLAPLARLSHAVERVAIALCRDDPDDERVKAYLLELAGHQGEVLAIALSYVLRRRETSASLAGVDRAAGLLAATLRNLSEPAGGG